MILAAKVNSTDYRLPITDHRFPMHTDARILENASRIEGDICIVGAGAAGISMALEWINTPYKVILLEGGGFEYDEQVQELYAGRTTVPGSAIILSNLHDCITLEVQQGTGRACVRPSSQSILSREIGWSIAVGRYGGKSWTRFTPERIQKWSWVPMNIVWRIGKKRIRL